jgi:hypothetical protein
MGGYRDGVADDNSWGGYDLNEYNYRDQDGDVTSGGGINLTLFQKKFQRLPKPPRMTLTFKG